jgi:CubicO group peptidase (beta-lactamase class C family)
VTAIARPRRPSLHGNAPDGRPTGIGGGAIAATQYAPSVHWLRLIVEKVGPVGLDAYVRAHICEPLGMFDTTF